MSFIQILSTFRAYGLDVMVLALGVTLTVALLKKTVMKNVSKKVFVFLPFLVGLLFYAAFRAIVTLSTAPFTSEIERTLEGGFSCGCAATLYYVVYEQFLRGKSVSPLYPFLEGIVPEEKREEAANALYLGCTGKTESELEIFFSETLKTYFDTPMPEEELSATVKLLVKFCSAIQKK